MPILSKGGGPMTKATGLHTYLAMSHSENKCTIEKLPSSCVLPWSLTSKGHNLMPLEKITYAIYIIVHRSEKKIRSIR